MAAIEASLLRSFIPSLVWKGVHGAGSVHLECQVRRGRSSFCERARHLADRTPWQGDQDSALHVLNERDGLVDGLRPAFDIPGLLTANLAFLQVRKLPQMMHSVQIADLDEPRTNSFHDFPARLEATAPMGLPLQQVSGMERIRSQLKDTAEAARRGRWPEGKLLHERGTLALNHSSQLAVELVVSGQLRNGI